MVSKMAKWIRGETVGIMTHLWSCSACNSTYEVSGIYTPFGLGYQLCPFCHAEMTGIEQRETTDGE